MKCPSCEKENPEKATFCRGCGKPLATQSPPTPQAQPVYQQSPQPVTQTPQQPTDQAQYQQKSYEQPVSDPIDENQYVAPPFSSGFADIINSKGWFVRSVLLALCGLVPILDWVIAGFAVRWGREVCIGVNRRLPVAIFDNRTFSTGAKVWLVGFLYTIILVCLFFLCMVIPVLGPILFIIIYIGCCLILPLLIFQVGLTGKISAGFSGIARALKLFKKAPVKTIAATIVPSFLLDCLLSFFVGVFSIAISLGFGGSLTASSISYLSQLTPSTSISDAPVNLISSLMGLIGSFIVVFIIVWALSKIISAVSTIWTYRAIGHLVAREAPEWMTTPNVMDYEQSRGEVTGTPFVPFKDTQTTESEKV